MLVLVSVVCMDNNKILHVVHFEVLFHVVERIQYNFFFLLSFLFRDLNLSHKISNFPWLLDILHDAAILSATHTCTGVTPTTHSSPLVRRSLSTPQSSKAWAGVSSTIESPLIFRKEGCADLSKLSLPFQVVSQPPSHHKSRRRLMFVFLVFTSTLLGLGLNVHCLQEVS